MLGQDLLPQGCPHPQVALTHAPFLVAAVSLPAFLLSASTQASGDRPEVDKSHTGQTPLQQLQGSFLLPSVPWAAAEGTDKRLCLPSALPAQKQAEETKTAVQKAE